MDLLHDTSWHCMLTQQVKRYLNDATIGDEHMSTSSNPGLLPTLFACTIMLWIAADARGEIALVDAGEAHAHVVLAADASTDERAAAEIVEHIELITGTTLAIHDPDSAPTDGVAIRLGAAAGEQAHALVRDLGANREAFALVVENNAVHIAGLSPEATRHGAYELLEQLGVRWFMPGEFGTVLPETDTLTLAIQRTVQSPDFTSRQIGGTDSSWARRMRLGGVAAASSLSMPGVGDFDDYPERYALFDGQRHPRQLCVSNPEVIEAMAEHMRRHFAQNPQATWLALGTHGGGHCQCGGCRAMDPSGAFGPYTGGINVTDRYVSFANAVLERVEQELPDKRLTLAVASPHMLPPVNEHGHPRLDVTAWAVGYCRFHGPNNPVCPELTMIYERTLEWMDKLEGDYYQNRSWGNVAGPGLLFPGVHRFRQEMPDYHAAGVAGFSTAAYSHWISENPSSHIGAKLLWDSSADVDALLADFYDRYYGPAAEPMRRYHELIDHAVRDADHHTGTALDMPHIYPQSLREAARSYVNESAERAEGIQRQRVHAVALALDYLDAFITMLERRDRHDYAGAVEALVEARQLVDRLTSEYDPPLLNPRYARPYLDRFFGNAIEQAHERTSGGHDLVAGLDDQWDFQTDPQRIGEDMGWWKFDLTGGNWQTIAAYSSSWSNQSLRYYQGHAWYRQRVDVPEQFDGRTVMLWIGGVDEKATVWINGEKLATSPIGAFRPFESDATEALRFGTENVVVIRVRNQQQEEVGTGGLLAPVMLYATPGQ